jgi:hypothetical protein
MNKGERISGKENVSSKFSLGDLQHFNLWALWVLSVVDKVERTSAPIGHMRPNGRTFHFDNVDP